MQIAQGYRADECRAYATSALREARNNRIVLDQIRVRTGLKAKIISKLGAALPHLQGHRREGCRIQPDDPEGDGHGGRGLRRHADLPVRQGCPGDHPESSPGCDAPAGVFEPPAERQPGEPHGASGRDGGQRALHLPQDVPEGPGDQKSDRHGEHGDPSGQTFSRRAGRGSGSPPGITGNFTGG